MYKLKIDPKLYYHYLISVGVRDMRSEKRGRMYLKHGPLKFTNDDVKQVQSAKMLSEDKLFKTESIDALKNFGVTELVNSVYSILLAATANNCTVHHFSSDTEIDDDYWEGFVDRANDNEFERRKILESKTGGRGFI